jgi:bifunctional non-homologous end joining protein LigD
VYDIEPWTWIKSVAKAELLEKYRRKRQSDGTPEPFGRASLNSGGAPRFVVHHHAARNTHFDLRLEMEGVLRSWAVPKGPSPNVKDKRFAALVEDHPLEYGDFEGMIPDGNYGAGWSIVWDRGFYRPIGDPVEGIANGKVLFELQGQKLHGKWTLVRIKSKGKDTGKDWLFIKEIDEQMDESRSTDDYPMNSVFSGLSIEDLDAGINPEQNLRKSVARMKPAKQKIKALKPMLATAGEAFSRKDWLFEIKYDGYRLLCSKEGDETTLLSRNGNDLSRTFPEIVQAVSRLPYHSFVIDGEAVVHDASGMPSFARMQRRGRLNKPSAIERAMRDYPASLYAFDLLAFAEYDLRKQPLIDRKSQLREMIPQVGMIKYSDHIEQDGQAMYLAAERLGLEGMVAKSARSRYAAGRSDQWIKVRIDQTDDFVVMGYRAASNGDIRSLMVGQYVGDDLIYSGNVGSGLNDTLMRQLSAEFNTIDDVSRPAEAPKNADFVWKQPTLVCEIRYKEITPSGQLRHPVILHLRDDKEAKECTRESVTHELEGTVVEDEPVDRSVQLSNLDKVFWPNQGLTKGDMIEYYEAVSPWLLPWLADRPLVMTRYPDGIDGKSFYQKDAPGFVPEWIRIEKMWSSSTERDIGYFIVDCTESLVYIANMASIPLHMYHSRVGNIEHPDWCVLDLDPKEAPFSDVITVAKMIHRVCDEIGLPNYVKTSGSTGLHILLPLNNQFTFEQSRIMGELLARIVVRELPEICTVTRNPARRDGKVYIDYLQNGSGKLIASTYCVRPKENAPVSMPVHWREVNSKLRPDSFHIKNAIRRLKRQKSDLALDVLDVEVDLIEVLEALTSRYTEINA